MKHLFLPLVLAFAGNAAAQIEVKLSPFALLIPATVASVEIGLAPAWGLDADLIFVEDYFLTNVSGKYYFNPQKGIDRFHIGVFGTVADATAGAGFLLGYKIVSKNRILFEVGLGLGRLFDGDIAGYGKLHVGYRFGKRPAPNE